MKIRASIIWLVAIVAALIVLVFWLGKGKLAEAPQAVAAATNSTSLTVAATNSRASTLVHSNAPSVAQYATGVSVPTQTLKTKEQQMREGLAELNNEDVVLYGRVIDQFGSPVVSATVNGSIQVNDGTRVGKDKISLVTDGNGFFTISGYKGKALGINVNKAGYVLATTNTRFVYSLLWPESERYIPDAGNPAVIKMWKLQGTEPLASIDKTYKLHYIGTPINFDLLTGAVVPTGGDLKITVNRPSGEVSEHNPQDWSVRVEAVDGGLMRTTVAESRVTYAAPEAGYQPSDTFTMSTVTRSWHAAVDQAFFIQSRNGKVFSKVRLILGINEMPDGFMDIMFSGIANANGSGNWEATAQQ